MGKITFFYWLVSISDFYVPKESYYLCKKIVLASAKKNKQSALKVNQGIAQPPSFNPEAAKHYRSNRPGQLSASDYIQGILSGNRMLLSQAITIIESSLPAHKQLAREIINACLPHTHASIRIGITGVPGVGKSTFIEALGSYITAQEHQLAVLAIDPSSERTGGSILGDKTRMENLAANPRAFIRPSPSAGSLGGVARKTKETIVLCEAAGFDVIFVETVGVGQSETAVKSMVDFFLLLMLPGAGDELQGIKKGIMEMADALIINKADGDNVTRAKLAMQQYRNAMHLFPASPSGWIPRVEMCSSLNNTGIESLWALIGEYQKMSKENGYFLKNRKSQEIQILHESIRQQLSDDFFNTPSIKVQLTRIKEKIRSGKMSAYEAGTQLLDAYYRLKEK